MEDIRNLRKKIDAVDEQILFALGERTKLCTTIGLIKKKRGLPIKDRERERGLHTRIMKRAASMKLDTNHVEAIYRHIIEMCTSVQQ
jgi:chorismate mutase